MGSRTLRRWLNAPTRERELLRERYHAVGTLAESRRYEALRERLADIGDLERILARIALRSARPRDLVQLRASLQRLPPVREALIALDSPLLSRLRADIGTHEAERSLLERAIDAEPAHLLRDGGGDRTGFDATLDELRAIASHTDDFLLELERRERERSGIASLKLGYNRVQGFLHRDSALAGPRAARRLRATTDREIRGAVHHTRARELRGPGTRRARAIPRTRERTLRDRAHRADPGAAGPADQRRGGRGARRTRRARRTGGDTRLVRALPDR